MNAENAVASKVNRLAALQALATDPHYSMRCLEVSTAHVPRATAVELESGRWEGFYVHWKKYGWIFPLDETQIEAARSTGHAELAALMELAVEVNYGYLRLDADALTLPEAIGLPEFDW